MPDMVAIAKRNDELLAGLGFAADTERWGVHSIAHPSNSKVQLVASSRVEGRLDLFTQFGSSPLNTPGDPLNICIGINDHDKALVEAVAKTVVAQFLALSV